MIENRVQEPEIFLPTQISVQRSIAHQAVCMPGMMAVIRGGQYLTYAQLERQANQLAWALLKREVGPGVCVAVCFTPSVDLMVALLAILKVGGCILVLERGEPSEQLRMQMEECQVALLLTQRKIGQYLVAYRGEILCLDRDQFLWVGESSSGPCVPSCNEQKAAIVYTAHPERVQLSQRDLLVSCLDYIERLRIERGWRSSVSATQRVELVQLLAPLLSGGYLEIVI